MCLYVDRIFVRRVRRHCHQLHCPPNIFRFESQYALAGSYAQEVMLHSCDVPTIDGFQCPTVHQDAEQNALLKALLFTPFCCTTPMTCGSVFNFRHMLSSSRGSGQIGAGCASQSTSSNQLASSLTSAASDVQLPLASPVVGGPLQPANESYTFKRAWKRAFQLPIQRHRQNVRFVFAARRARGTWRRMYVCMYECMHVCMYVCMYVWM